MTEGQSGEKMLKGFEGHGLDLEGGAGSGQRNGDCPFCGKRGKFYVNESNGLWDCKVCGKSGNFLKFLELVAEMNEDVIAELELEALCKDRGLPAEAFAECNVGFNGEKYTFPVRGPNGTVEDVRLYKPGHKIMGSAGCQTGLWNADKLAASDPRSPVYLCEGEWDGMAMQWLVRKLKKPGVVVAVPGANTFKRDWLKLFEERDVLVLYDNDEAGESGQLIAMERLTGVAKSIKYLHWPAIMPQGFDIRDLVSRRAVTKNKPNATWEKINGMLQPQPVRAKEARIDKRPGTTSTEEQEQRPLTKTTKDDVFKVVKKWLFMKSMDGAEIAMAAMISNKLDGDPLWMFIVAPPGGAKTEILSTFMKCPDSYFTSSLTPHSLISGSAWTSGGDPSLIPKLDKKVLVIKDFTTILTKRDIEKDEIFGILRDAYDGSCSKVFGTGVRRHYVSKFSILSAVTPKIYELADSHASLGERFLKFCIGENLEHFSEMDVIDRAINNLQKETSMREEMSNVMSDFIAWQMHKLESSEKRPLIPRDIQVKLVALAQFGARMRGSVARDKYRPEHVLASPSAEVGSRLGKQLAKLAISLAIVNGRTEVNDDDYRLVKKTMLDTISQKAEHMVRVMVTHTLEGNRPFKTKDVSYLTRFPQSTVSRMLSDLDLLKVVERRGTSNKYEWGISPYMQEIMTRAELYTERIETERKSMAVFITKRKVVIKPNRRKKNHEGQGPS